MSNPEKPNLEAALSSTPVAAKKSRFRPSFRSPRIPRETKLGLAIIFSLVSVFGYVLYSRLTRPADMDAEQYVAQGKSALGPSVTNNQPTALTAQPASHSPTILAGTAPQNALPPSSMSLADPNNIHASPTPYSAPAGTAGQAAWSPNSSNSAAATPSSDPFINRGASNPDNTASPAASFSANGFSANSNTNTTAANSTTQPAATTAYGLSNTNTPREEPRNSFSPLPDQSAPSTPALNASLTQPEPSAATASNSALPTGNAFEAANHSATTPAAGTTVDAFGKAATDSMNTLRQEGQNLVNAGNAATQNLGKTADNAGQMLNQAQQQFGQYTNTAGNNASAMLNQTGQTATQYSNELKKEAQTQANQFTNQLRNTTQDQFQQAQNQFRSNANTLVNDTTNQLRATTESVMSKASDSTSNLMNSATTAINGGQPLSPLPTTSSGTQPASGYGMPASATEPPRTLNQAQAMSQPLSNSAFSTVAPPEQPIRIPAEYTPRAATQPSTATQPNYGATSTAATPNYGTTTTAPNYGTTPAYGTTPSYGGATTTPSTSGTPLQFNQPATPATQPAQPAFNGATRTNFEQPATTSTISATRGGVQQYTVTAQDSYYSVAEKMYGNGAFNKALYEYNRRNNPAADRLQVGGAMLVPDLGTLQAQFPDLVPSVAAPATATISPTPLQFPR